METLELRVDTGGRHVLDLTDRAAAFAAEAGGDGLLQVFVPHAPEERPEPDEPARAGQGKAAPAPADTSRSAPPRRGSPPAAPCSGSRSPAAAGCGTSWTPGWSRGRSSAR